MKKGPSVLLLALFFGGLIVATLVAFLAQEVGRPPAIPAASYLDIKLEGALVEYPQNDLLSALFLGARPLSVHDVWMALRKARVDDRIAGVLLRVGPLACEWAKCAEIRDAIGEFRKAGKPIFAHIQEGPEFDKEYYLASACEKIFLHPLGWFGISGVGGPAPFFKKALDKLGVELEVLHVEQYKTAYNMFTESGYTPAHREMISSIAGDTFGHYVRAVAAARRKSEAEVRSLIDEGFFEGERAVAAGLVDDLLFEDQVIARFEKGGRPVRRVPLSLYGRIDPASLGLATGRKIALIYAVGPIHGGESLPQSIGAETLARWLAAARRDASIAAVVLRVDSPGGSAVASDSIWREVMLCRKAKPVVVSMSDVAGSGGYWISMAANKIVAQPQTLTGSIGVLFAKFNMEKLLAKIGVTAETVGSGKHLDVFSPFRSWTAEEAGLLKKQILWIYDRFLAKAAEARGLSKDDIDKIGKGRVWTGSQARDLRLVDEVGGLSRAIDLAKGLAGIPREEEVRLAVWPRRESLFGSLFRRSEPGIGPALPGEWRAALSWISRLNQDGIWAVMPFVPGF